jgi:hypothetical protein
LSWEQDGYCYLSWKDASGTDFVAFSACQDAEGYFTCEITGESAECVACNLANECNACDMESEESACAWPGAEPTEDVVYETTYEDTYEPYDAYLPDGYGNDDSVEDPCGECVQMSCGTESAACDANADCLALSDCLGQCADEACQSTCQETYSGGVDDFFAWQDCWTTYCADLCQ